MFNYYSGLIALRKAHPAFRLGDAEQVRKHLEFLSVPQGVVAFRLKDNAGGDSWNDIIVVLNANKEALDISIPDGSHTIVAENGTINLNGIRTINGNKITVNAQTATILH